jgi:hypothetical protein
LWPLEIGNVSVENGFIYFPVTMTILHNPKTWYRKVKNAGYYMKGVNTKFRRRDGVNGGPMIEYYPVEPIIFSNGKKADRPILLWNTPDDLKKHGRPIQMVITGEAPDNQDPRGARKIKTYDILSPDDFGRRFTAKELTETTLQFRTRAFLNFTKELPLT